jgi:hypothetical protein
MACLKVRRREPRAGAREGADAAVRPVRINPRRSPSGRASPAAIVRRVAIAHLDVTGPLGATARPDGIGPCPVTIAAPCRATEEVCRHAPRPARSAIAGPAAAAVVVSRAARTISAAARRA